MKQLVFKTSLFIIILAGCNGGGKNSKTYSEGKLEYKIVYPQELVQEGLTTFLPEKMITFFKNGHTKLHMQGGLGIYSLEYISRSLGDTCYTKFKIFDKRMYYPMNKEECLFFFKELGKPQVKLLNDSVKQIAGFSCYRAEVSFPKSNVASAEVYYTQQIDVEKPNINTPFEEIPGVLMKFDLAYKRLNFKMIAQKFTPVSIASSEFLIPKRYNKTSAEEIEDLILSVLQ